MNESSWTSVAKQVLQNLTQQLSEYLPNLLGALLLIGLGWGLAHILRLLIKGLVKQGLTFLGRYSSVQAALSRMQASETVSLAVSRVVFWIVFLFFIAAGIEALGLPVVTNLLNRTATYLPNILAAFLIMFVGLLVGNLSRNAIISAAASANLTYGPLLAQLAYVGILLMAVIVSIDQLGIDSTFLNVIASTLLATTLGSTALAFGLGARTAVSNIIASHYVQKTYQIGQKVKIDNYEGRIIQIDPTMITVETAEGRLKIPAKLFSESPSLILSN